MDLSNLTATDRLNVEKELCRRSLAYFARRAWHVLEPATPLKWGWVLDGICAHLEAVTRGEENRIVMNVPPGTMKSLLTSVIWPAWEWGPAGMPHLKVMRTAHKADLALRDNRKCRMLIQSDWFQKRWPITMMSDQNIKTKFENNKTGFQEAMAFTGMTGSRGDRVILDDPISAHHANSPAHLHDAEIAFRETLPTRVNNETSAIVVIMQRLHEMDVTGIIQEYGFKYLHFVVPMEYDATIAKSTKYCQDPRTEDGELMFPERFGPEQIEELKKTLGVYATAGQLQQRPAPRGGAMFQREWFEKNTVSALPAGCRLVRGWDFAATDDDPGAARTAGVLMAEDKDGNLYIVDSRAEHLSANGVIKLLKLTAAEDKQRYKSRVRGSIPQDPGQAGKAQVQFMIKELKGHRYSSSLESGNKITRAEPFAAQAEAGNVYMVKGDWNKKFLDEIEVFPNGKTKDQVDAAARAFNELIDGPKGYSIEQLRAAYDAQRNKGAA